MNFTIYLIFSRFKIKLDHSKDSESGGDMDLDFYQVTHMPI